MNSLYEDTLWLDWFAILPEFRRKGYGKEVMTKIDKTNMLLK